MRRAAHGADGAAVVVVLLLLAPCATVTLQSGSTTTTTIIIISVAAVLAVLLPGVMGSVVGGACLLAQGSAVPIISGGRGCERTATVLLLLLLPLL